MQLEKLRDKFLNKDIEWKPLKTALKKDGTPYALLAAYINNRAIMDRLDAVVGPGNWKNEFQFIGGKGVMCGLAIKIDNEWITKWDGAEESDIEPFKGGLSNAMKRASVQWGIGRYLYDLPDTYATFVKDKTKATKSMKIDGKWFNYIVPVLPEAAIPVNKNKEAPGGEGPFAKYIPEHLRNEVTQ